MNILVVYDSVFGNTKKIAQAIGDTLRSQSDISVQPVGDVKIDQLHWLDLLIVGSPTRIFKPTKAINGFLGGIPGGGIEGLDVAAFDTRFAPEDIESRFLHFMVKRFGYAAEPILEKLKKKG